jgi:hypothetical protein
MKFEINCKEKEQVSESFQGKLYILPPRDSGQYHNLLPRMIEHQVHSNAFACLSEYGQSDDPIWRRPSIFMDVAMWEHCTFDCDIFIHYHYYFCVNFHSHL